MKILSKKIVLLGLLLYGSVNLMADADYVVGMQSCDHKANKSLGSSMVKNKIQEVDCSGFQSAVDKYGYDTSSYFLGYQLQESILKETKLWKYKDQLDVLDKDFLHYYARKGRSHTDLVKKAHSDFTEQGQQVVSDEKFEEGYKELVKLYSSCKKWL